MKESELENVTLRDSADLCKLAERLGYRGISSSSASSLLTFFDDNPGAMEAVAEWVLKNLAEEDDEEDVDEEDVVQEDEGVISTREDIQCVTGPSEPGEMGPMEERMKLEIEKVLVVSTQHITEEDNYLLENVGDDNTFIVNNLEYFFLVPLNQELSGNFGSKFSIAFGKLFEFAKNHEEGFTHLKLNRDGDCLEGFEEFDW